MHKSNLTVATIVIFFSFSGAVWAQAQTPALQSELDKVAGKTTKVKKEKESKKNTTPTTAPAGETDREKIVRLRALAIEANANLKKAEREAHKAESPAMKQAERQIAHEEKQQAKIKREARRVIADAQITGCPDGNFWVNPEVEPPHWVTRIYQSVVVRVVNTSALPIEIASSKGVVARNLCPRGSMTMTFFLGLLDSDNVPIQLTAVARPADGGIATAQFSVYLNRNNYYQRVDSQTWMVSLNRQRQTR